jgi:transposase
MATVTVLTGPERRRRWSSAEKLRMVTESLAPGALVSEVARRHDIHPNLLHLWRRQARTGGLSKADDECRFAPVAIAPVDGAVLARRPAAGGEPVIEVVLRNGRVLRLPDGVATARAVTLADALEGRGQ